MKNLLVVFLKTILAVSVLVLMFVLSTHWPLENACMPTCPTGDICGACSNLLSRDHWLNFGILTAVTVVIAIGVRAMLKRQAPRATPQP